VIPIKDDNPTTRTPIVTIVLMAACVLVFVGFQQKGDQNEFTYRRAAVPCEVVTGTPMTAEEITSGDCTRQDTEEPVFPQKSVLAALLTSMFLHGSWLHLGGNLLYLWVFGNNIEDRMGRGRYLLFYLVAGVVATFAHIALDPGSTVPLIGASGAIAGVMGAYLVVFPKVRIRTLFIMFLILFRDVQARWLLLFWFVLQFFTDRNGGVAWAAHVGGFVFGGLVGLFLRTRGDDTRFSGPYRYPDPSPPPYA
jgi:membrane associated rhomboid family serine protease